ncbi:MAG: MATE family efflux transporter [Tenuifilaceae bacterium]|jgi:putative MATE family efflux protein|nr:MATE family efflux transporter [Tenuifilaceae bacterium]
MNRNKFIYQFNRIKEILSEIKDSIAGAEVDYTSLSMRKALILLSIPMVLEMLMESIFTICDIYFVSKLGAEAVSIVGLTESMLTMVYAFGIGFAISATAIVSRRIGEKDPRGASAAAAQAMIVVLLSVVIISLVGFAFSKDLLRLMGADAEIVDKYYGYTQWMLAGNGTIMLLFVLNGIFRGAGNAAIAMRVLWAANIINIVLDPMLIFGYGPFPALGVEGAAIATNIGRGSAVLYQLYILFFGKSAIRIKLSALLPDFTQIAAFLKLSYSGILQLVIAQLSWIGLVRIISTFGSLSIAGYTVGVRIMIFSLLPAAGISNAAATLVGQNLGAGNPQKAEKSAWVSGLVNAAFMGVIGLMLVLWAEPIVSFLTGDPEVVVKGAECLRIMSIGFVAYGFGMVMVHSLNGSGDTLSPMVINLICFWAIEIPLAYYLAIVLGYQEKGVYYSIVVAESLMTLLALLVFRRGKWKFNVV